VNIAADPSRKSQVEILSLNHLVRAEENGLGQPNAERLGNLEVDDQLELRRLLDWQVASSDALEDLVHENCGALEGRAGIIDLLEHRRIFIVVAELRLSKALLYPIEDLAGNLK
jgi:hypothetical protein